MSEHLAELGQHVLRGRRAHATEAVGARGGDTDGCIARQFDECIEHRVHRRVRRDPHGDGVLAASDEVTGPVGAVRDEGERAGPEGVGQGAGVVGDVGRPRHRGGGIAHVHDQRMVGGPALGGVDAGDGVREVGAGAEPVDRLGGQCRQVAGSQRAGGGCGVGGGEHGAIQPRGRTSANRRCSLIGGLVGGGPAARALGQGRSRKDPVPRRAS